MAYKGPYIVKLSVLDGNCYISRGMRRFQIPAGELHIKALEALVSAKLVHDNDHLLEHWIDGKWQSRQSS